MALVSGIKKRVDFPHEPGQWAEIRKLSWRLLDAAREKKSKAVIRDFAEYPPELLQSRINDAGGEQAIRDREKDPLAEYDHDYLLEKALEAWSYDAPVSEYGDLDEDTKAFLIEQIVAFNAKQRTEAERRDGSQPSIAS